MKVKFLPYQPHCFVFGGFEIQILSTLAALHENGVKADMMDIWSKDQNFDILHCWGLGIGNYENVYFAKNAGKKVVVTALLPYYESTLEKLKHLASSLIYKVRIMQEMAALVDRIVVLNSLQAEICVKYFKVSPDKVSIVPNVVSHGFYSHSTSSAIAFNTKYGTSNFVLTTGNICQRKNQLKLAEACVENNLNLVIIGKVLDGEAKYGQDLQKIVAQNSNIVWIKGLEPGSADLIGAYAACNIMALPSYIEQQPISLLEAAAMRKPLLIANRAYAKQKYYQNACLVNPDSLISIAEGLKTVSNNSATFIPPSSYLEDCRSVNVGRAYKNVYNSIL